MKNVKIRLIGPLLLLAAASAAGAVPPADDAGRRAALPLSPGLLELFRAEMRELSLGAQALAAALPAADWDGIAATSRRMKASYVLEKKMTPEQAKEVAALPERFKELDAGFHARTDRLAAAADRHDYEGAAHEYARLLETCGACHGAFAHTRFPGFGPPAPAAHHH
jgi:cytochrome c556